LSHSHSARRIGVAVVCAVGVVVTGPGVAQAASKPIRKLGTVNARHAATSAKPVPSRVRPTPSMQVFDAFEARRHPEELSAAARGKAPALAPPNVAGASLTSAPSQRGFEGLDIRDTFFSQGFELEPPDQGLCGGTFQGTTYLFEETNLALAVYDTRTNQYTPPNVGINALYGLPPAFDFDTGTFGPFLSDPKCYFDVDTGRWYHTILEADVNPKTGALTGGANTLVAASTSRDPLGSYNIYAIDASHSGCNVCIGDQPLLGADANGLFVSTAEYDLAPPTGSPGFFGPQIYAMDKRALSAGDLPTVVHFDVGVQKTGSLQPATVPTDRFETAQNGTEYLMGAFDCEVPDCHVDEDSLENTIQLWAVTRTRTLRTPTPSVRLLEKTLSSQVYGQPVPQGQKDGFRPLGEADDEPNPEIEANDSRMNQVVYAAGRLWGGVNTRVAPGDRDGIAWFQVDPSVSANSVSGNIKRQGYMAAKRNHTFLTFPSIGVTDAGRAVLAYSFMGDAFFPSAAHTTLDLSGPTSNIRIVRNGFRPEDGFTCYEAEGFGPECRWGDYSASFALPSGEVWSATEFIGDNPRTEFANWSTFVWPVTP
jgi:hypothetical protein